eukprot:1385853-Ditylum_brightwellii.AAC.1
MKLNINFPYASKHREKGFSFYIPKYMHKLFDKYKKQLADHGRSLQKWNNKDNLHVQNMGINHPRTKFCRIIEEKFGLAEENLTAHFGRRSGAVAFADAGISIPNLKQAGRWASTLAVEEYMEHSHASKKECLTLLDTKKRKAVSEKETNSIERSSVKKMKKGTLILYAVTTAMITTATMTMITAELTKWKKQHHQSFHLTCYVTISSKNK